MSLISDPDYLIHNLRLTYLRHLEDPYGPRIIKIGSRYLSNPHVIAAGLADAESWPELNAESSPDPSDDEAPKAPMIRRVRSGQPGGANLNYTQTIMGSRAGMMGMRTSGKRSLTVKETPLTMRPSDSNLTRMRADSEPTPLPTAASSPVEIVTPGSPDTFDGSLGQFSKRRSAGGSSLSEITTSLAMKPEVAPPSFIETQAPRLHMMPSFSRIADMQARRQRRRAHFSSAGNNTNRPVIRPLDPEISSSDEEGSMSGSVAEDHGFDPIIEGRGDGDADEFDPDFAPPPIGGASDVSAAGSSVSHLNSVTSPPVLDSLQLPYGEVARRNPSPIEEEHSDVQHPRPERRTTGNPEQSAVTTQNDIASQPHELPVDITRPLVGKNDARGRARKTRRMTLLNNTAPPTASAGLFTKLQTLPPRPSTSALTAKLASSNTSTNPFTETYALISGRSEVASMTIQVFFPHARAPSGRALSLSVRKDATVEEVIGFALWSYWEESWEPKLDEGLSGADEMKKRARLSAVGWVLRIAEEDGEVDEDFPAPDRMGKISKFNFDAYAILEANMTQIVQNQQLESKLVRRPSRIMVTRKRSEPAVLAPAPSLGQSLSAGFGSALDSSYGLSTSLNISSSHGPQVLLRINIEDAADAVHYSTTISVSATMYMQEVLEHICRKWKLPNPKEWALVSQDFKVLIPVDRTVASLEGNSELVLVKRTSLPQHGFPVDGDRKFGRSTDPNASIFKRISDIPSRGKYTETSMDFIAAYKRYTVFRKVPMLVGRLERTLAIDGEYIHIMPSANKAKGVFETGKTYSYHIKSVTSCQQSSKTSASFKLVFRRDGSAKRYDFEAETAKAAIEIVSTVRSLKTGLDRSSTVSKSRRSKHPV